MKKYSLYTVVLVIFAVLAAGVIGFTYVSGLQRENDLITRNVEEKIRLAETINQVMFNPQVTSRLNILPAIGTVLVKEASRYEDVVFVRIVGADGRVFYSSINSESWQTLRLERSFVETVSSTRRSVVNDGYFLGEKIKTVLYPSHSGDTFIWIGFTLRNARAEARAMFRREVTIGLCNLVLVVLVMFVALQTIVKPLQEMAATCKKIRAGDLSAKMTVNSRTEIGELAGTFNAMLESLGEMHEKSLRSEKLAVIGKLTSSVGHELRNPMSSIKNVVYFLNRYLKDQDSKVNEFLSVLSRDIDRANKIISDLLDFSRVKKLELKSAAVAALVEECLRDARVPQNIEVIREFAQGLPELLLDEDRIKQVFLNIITNAVQMMPSGGTITVRARPAGPDGGGDPQGKFVAVSIADTGPGMNEETKQHLFEPLFTTKTRGIGLGLAISNDIVVSHNGKIIVESGQDRGATFTVVLPLAAAPAGA